MTTSADRRCPVCQQYEEITSFTTVEGAHYCSFGGGWWLRTGRIWRLAGTGRVVVKDSDFDPGDGAA